MRGISQGNRRFERKVITADEAKTIFQDEPFKLELIEGLQKGKVDEHGKPVTEPVISIYSHVVSRPVPRTARGKSKEIHPKASSC